MKQKKENEKKYLFVAIGMAIILVGGFIFVPKLTQEKITINDVVVNRHVSLFGGQPTLSEYSLIQSNYRLQTVDINTTTYGLINISSKNVYVPIFDEDEINTFASEHSLRIIDGDMQKIFVVPEPSDPADLSMEEKCLIVPFQYYPAWVEQPDFFVVFTENGKKCFSRGILSTISPLQTFKVVSGGVDQEGEYLMKYDVLCYQINPAWLGTLGSC